MTFSARYRIYKHFMLHTRSMVVSCDICDEDFNDVSPWPLLLRFLFKHIPWISYISHVQIVALVKHKKRHFSDGVQKDVVTYGCDICPRKFERTTELFSHREVDHIFPKAENPKLPVCRFCQEIFPRRGKHFCVFLLVGRTSQRCNSKRCKFFERLRLKFNIKWIFHHFFLNFFQ